ncbi:hypothetical protein GQ457_12G027460 [Hibiscus cannabinus]
MEFDPIAKFLQGKTILVTRATGFLSKVFVEKILRLQPKVNKLYLLLRAQDEESAIQRLNEEKKLNEALAALNMNTTGMNTEGKPPESKCKSLFRRETEDDRENESADSIEREEAVKYSGSKVKDVLFEPVRKTQDAMFFFKTPNDMWIPCGPKQSGAVQITMQELAAKGLAAQILPPPISKSDFDKVLARQRPTVSKADLEVHERFTKEFGEEC